MYRIQNCYKVRFVLLTDRDADVVQPFASVTVTVYVAAESNVSV